MSGMDTLSCGIDRSTVQNEEGTPVPTVLAAEYAVEVRRGNASTNGWRAASRRGPS